MKQQKMAPPVRSTKTEPSAPARSSVIAGSMASQQLLQMQKVLGNRAVARYLTTARQGVIQGKFELESGKPVSKTTKKDGDVAGLEGSEGKITQHESDSSLPTFYGVLKTVFGNNLNDAAFETINELGTNCDRPHSVSALITKQTQPDPRLPNAMVSAIGRLGNEEMKIRDGEVDGSKVAYDGGHLVGYQVLGGENADNAWNVAPQDRENNQGAYNYTIEQMLRKAKRDTVINYKVELGYRSLNFSVDQNQLKAHGIIFDFDNTKPWEVQLPSRVPYRWEANANIASAGGSFGNPAEKNADGDNRTYKQMTNILDGNNLKHDNNKFTALYMLKYEDAANQAMDYDQVRSNVEQVRSINYNMMQVQASDRHRIGKPGDWTGPDKTNFGEVIEDRVTLEEIAKLEQELRDLVTFVQGNEDNFQDTQSHLVDLDDISEMIKSEEQFYEAGQEFVSDVAPLHDQLLIEIEKAKLYFGMKENDEKSRDMVIEEMGKNTVVLDLASPQELLLRRKQKLKIQLLLLQGVRANRESRKEISQRVIDRRVEMKANISKIIKRHKKWGKNSQGLKFDKRKINRMLSINRGLTPNQMAKQLIIRFKKKEKFEG